MSSDVSNTLDTLSIIPSGAPLGAEVQGIDLRQPIPGAVAEALRQVWYEYLILLFRNQQMSDEDLVACGEIFGGLQDGATQVYFEKAGIAYDPHYVPGFPQIVAISNLDENGVPVKENAGLGSLDVDWHSDNSYVDTPPAGSMLYSIEVPQNAGGDTYFSNQYVAYETLPVELACAIEGRYQIHDRSRNSAGVLRPGLNLPKTTAEVEGPAHPLVRVHPGSGRRALYLGRRRAPPSNYILGMRDDESEALLAALWDHATQPEFAWRHVWRKGDAVLWDNRCAMHRRDPIADGNARVMHRIQILGDPVLAPWDDEKNAGRQSSSPAA